MAGEMITSAFMKFYNELVAIMPEHLQIIPPAFLIAVAITLYSIFVYLFYRFMARRDVLKLNLKRYNRYKFSFFIKFFAVLFYLIEFVIVGPIFIFLWFSGLSMIIIVFAKDLEVGTVMMICAALIAAVRITAYFSEDLSKDLAKLIPLALLGSVLVTPGLFEIGTTVERFLEIPSFFDKAIYYLLFIFFLEAVLRIFLLPLQVAYSVKGGDGETETVKKDEESDEESQ